MGEGWTLATLKEHFDALRLADKEAVATALNAAEKATNAALEASEKAIGKAEIAANNRFDAGNEIKGAMENAQKSFATIETVNAQRERMDRIDKDISDLRGRSAGASQIIGYVLGAAGLVTLVVTVLTGGIG